MKLSVMHGWVYGNVRLAPGLITAFGWVVVLGSGLAMAVVAASVVVILGLKRKRWLTKGLRPGAVHRR